jgi:hypothetical protein
MPELVCPICLLVQPFGEWTCRRCQHPFSIAEMGAAMRRGEKEQDGAGVNSVFSTSFKSAREVENAETVIRSVKLAHDQLGPDQRGLIIYPKVEVASDNQVSMTGQFDACLLRHAVLMWDFLDWPTSNVIGLGSGDPDVILLLESGTLRRSTVEYSSFSGGGGKNIKQVFTETFGALDRRDAGRWSFVRGPSSLSFQEEGDDGARSLLVELSDAVPIPTAGVPLYEILQYRERRRAELLALRAHLEALYQAILAAPDRKLAQTTELQKLEKAIRDHLASAREARFPLRMHSLQAKLDLKSWGAAAAAYAVSAHEGTSLALQIGGAAAAALIASVSATISPQVKRTSTPFEYISRAGAELRPD